MKPLVIIPARGGSIGVPRKNIKLLNGKPLIQYTIDAARSVFSSDIMCVSTEDAEIKRVVEDLGLAVPFLRPAELATDTCGTRDVILHALSYYDEIGYETDVIVLLQVTSPFREAKHIKEAMSLYDETCDMVVSVKETKSNPYFVLMEEDENGWLQKSKPSSFVRRQDCPKVYEVNGAIYVMKRESLESYPNLSFPRVKKYVMDSLVSHDIDSMLDWELAELIVEKIGRISDNTR